MTRRRHLINFRFSLEQYDDICRSVAASGSRTVSEFCREAIVKAINGSQLQEIKRQLGQLERAATDLNAQLARLWHEQ